MKQSLVHFANLRLIQFSLRFLLGGVFIYASLDKIAFPKQFASIVMKYHILPETLAVYLAFLLPWIELFLGLFLIAGLFIKESAIAVSLLLLVFMAAMIVARLNGSLENCGCLSVRFSGSESLPALIGRDALLLLCGLALVFNKRRKPANAL